MLNRVTDYTILENSSETSLRDAVTSHMHDGWVPSGPLVIKEDQLLQVMIKFES